MSSPTLGRSVPLLVVCTALVACGPAKAPETAQPPAAAPPAVAAAPASAGAENLVPLAAGFDQLFMHDPCIGPFPPQPDTCLHERQHEKAFTFGGTAGATYDVTLRVRGIFEPTTIEGGHTPTPQHPYFKVGGKVTTLDWSYWHIEVSEPAQTYYLNHYPSVSHTIYQEDFTATIPVAAGAKVVVRVIDGNDRQIDNGKTGPDRQQRIDGVTPEPLAGQMLRLDVTDVRLQSVAKQ